MNLRYRARLALNQTRSGLRELAWLPTYRGALRRTTKINGERNDIVMLVVSNLRIDARVMREAKALAEAGRRVKVICPDLGLPSLADQPIDWGPGITFGMLPGPAGDFIMSFPWLLGRAMLDAARRERPFAFHCHDLTTAVVGLAAAREVGAYCVCDFHEWYSENVSWSAKLGGWAPHPRMKRTAYRLAERLALRRADAVITVCDSIAAELEALVPGTRKVKVIRNIPPLERNPAVSYPPLRAALGIADDQLLLLWQGGTGPSRMIEPIIDALALAPRVTLVIRGPSLDLYGEGYRERAARAGAPERLKLLPPVPSADVVAAAAGADVGVWTLPNISKNFYYALPNKIFEYLAAGLPLLVADFPEARKIAEGQQVGLCFDPYSPASIAAQLNRFVHEPGLSEQLRANVPNALRALDAAREWDKLIALYRGLGDERPAAPAVASRGEEAPVE